VRSPLTLLTLVLALLTAGFPCYRCAPAGGVGTTVLVGSHAHDAPDRGCGCGCDHDGCPDEQSADEAPCSDCDCDGHGPACCEHSSADPSALSARVALAPALALSSLPAPTLAADAAWVADEPWDAPVPRVPTENVVLLR